MTYLEPEVFKSRYLDYTVGTVEASGSYGENFFGPNFIVKTQDYISAFVRELNICCSYDSPYIVKVLHWTYDPLFINNGKARPYIFAQPRGVLLIDALRKGYITLEKAAQDMYLGMRFLHSDSLIHLDIKPENVVCFQNNNSSEWRATLIDFGLGSYGYNYKNGLFSYKRPAYTPGYKDPEYDIETYNSYDSDYYAYSASIVTLYARIVKKLNKSGNQVLLFFNADIMGDDEKYENLKQVCDMCLAPRQDRGNIREKVESLPFFDFLRNYDFSESNPLPNPTISNLSLNQDIFNYSKESFDSFISLPIKNYRARTGFLAWHLFQLFLSKYGENPDNISEMDIFKQNINNYKNSCYILASFIYEEMEYNISQETADTIMIVLSYLKGRVRHLTFWDYSRCATELYIHLYATLKPNYLNLLYNERKIYYIPNICNPNESDKNILYQNIIQKFKPNLVDKSKQSFENKFLLSQYTPNDLPDTPLVSDIDIDTNYEMTPEIISRFANTLTLPRNNIYENLNFLYEIISKKKIYDENFKTEYENYVDEIFMQNPIFNPLKIFFPEFRLE